MKKRHLNAAVAVAIASLLGPTAAMATNYEGTTRDAWLDGKLETAYLFNTHLNNFKIDTDVKGGVAYLSGTVESDIDKSLAVEIAKGIEGIKDVKDNLVVDANPPKREIEARVDTTSTEKRSFRQWFDDATTTAAVKSRLIGNENTKGLKIDVDTSYDIVTLSGNVASAEEKQLAEQLARNTSDVKDVHNELHVQ
jgi:hyperosmotically inducible periplasmic protein